MQSWTIFLEIIQVEPTTQNYRTECPDIFMEYYAYLSTIFCLVTVWTLNLNEGENVDEVLTKLCVMPRPVPVKCDLNQGQQNSYLSSTSTIPRISFTIICGLNVLRVSAAKLKECDILDPSQYQTDSYQKKKSAVHWHVVDSY